MSLESAGSLDGLRILDFSRVLAGPLATMVLGDLGAEVIKVERPDGGDDSRHWGPPYDEAGVATYFLAVNRNKQSRVFDLRAAEGVEAVRVLAAESDVIVENFRPGVMDRLGLGYDDLRATRPDVVYCSISAFGTGPGAALPGYDTLMQAVGGLMSITGEPDRAPQRVGVALVDVIAGLYATVGILAALRHRDRTGEGQLVEVELMTALLGSLVNQASAFTAGGVIPQRMGNSHPSVAASDLFATADGAVMLGAGNDKQFFALCRVLGLDWVDGDERFATNAERVRHRDLISSMLRDACAARKTDELVASMLESGVPAGPVNDIAQAFEMAESLGLAPIVSVPRGDGTPPVRLARSPIGMSVTPPTYRTAPPPLEAVRPDAQPGTSR